VGGEDLTLPYGLGGVFVEKAMGSSDEIAGGWPPKLNIEGLPSDEHKKAAHISSLLWDLMSFVETYRADLALFEFSRVNIDKNAWQLIAMRDAVMTVFHIDDLMTGVKATTKECSTLFSLVDTDYWKKSFALFQKTFPDLISIRNAVGHTGLKEVQTEKHSIKGNETQQIYPNIEIGIGATVSFTSCIFDRNKIGFNWKDQLRTQELSQNTLRDLEDVKRLFIQDF